MLCDALIHPGSPSVIGAKTAPTESSIAPSIASSANEGVISQVSLSILRVQESSPAAKQTLTDRKLFNCVERSLELVYNFSDACSQFRLWEATDSRVDITFIALSVAPTNAEETKLRFHSGRLVFGTGQLVLFLVPLLWLADGSTPISFEVLWTGTFVAFPKTFLLERLAFTLLEKFSLLGTSVSVFAATQEVFAHIPSAAPVLKLFTEG